jgi:hypothetical protein
MEANKKKKKGRRKKKGARGRSEGDFWDLPARTENQSPHPQALPDTIEH